MPKSRDEIQAQIDALTAELEGADSDDEIWIEEGGRKFQLKGNKATAVLSRFKDLWDTGDGAGGDGDGDGAGGDGDGDGAGGDPKPGGGGYFSRRKS